MSAKTSIFFIIDGPRLEAQAIMLASTLQIHARGCKLIAYARRDRINKLSHLTYKALEKCNIELRALPWSLPEQMLWNDAYPIGNKLLAASDYRNTDISVFLDTDIVLTRPVDFTGLLGGAEIAAVVSDYNTGNLQQDDWKDIYNFYGLDLPRERVRLLAGRKLSSLPYYNGGMVIFKELSEDKQKPFGLHWLENAVRFENSYHGYFARENIDQITLPVTACARGENIKALPNLYNFNLQSRDIKGEYDPAILHYHSMKFLWKTPKARAAIFAARNMLGERDFEVFRQTYWDHVYPRRFRHMLKPGYEEAQHRPELKTA